MTTAEQFTLLSIGLFTVSVRIGIRWRSAGPANWQIDDYLMPFTGLLFVAKVVAAYLVGAKFDGLTNSYMTPEQRENLSLDSVEYYNRVWGSKIQVIGWSFYAAILWGLKVCITALYGRLTTGISHLELRVKLACVILLATYLGVALTIPCFCRPFHHFWQVSPNPGRLCESTNSPAYVLVVLITNIATDLYLLSIPMPCSPEGAVSGSLWACREIFVAIVVSNLPIIHPLLRQLAKAVGLGAILDIKSKSRSQSCPLQDCAGIGNRKSTIRETHTHPLSAPNGSAWASDEHIVHTSRPEKSAAQDCGSISIAHEVSVRSDIAGERELSSESSGMRGGNWGPSNMASAGVNVPHDRVWDFADPKCDI
ncbi:hypothetical protein Q7P35_007467 [Cladosporium inversicolor]